MRPLAATGLLIVLAVGCGDDPVTPTGPTVSSVTYVTELFAGSLAVGGSRFYSFRVGAPGTVSVMLASVTTPATGLAQTRVLELGIGVPAGTGCATTTAQRVTPALASQVVLSSQIGTYCVRVADVGDLTGPVNFAVRLTHP